MPPRCGRFSRSSKVWPSRTGRLKSRLFRMVARVGTRAPPFRAYDPPVLYTREPATISSVLGSILCAISACSASMC